MSSAGYEIGQILATDTTSGLMHSWRDFFLTVNVIPDQSVLSNMPSLVRVKIYTKFTISTVVDVQFGAVKCIHIVVHSSPPTISGTFFTFPN